MFTKEERSTFPYWFAHWCAFQLTALNLRIWKPKYLLHDIEKPWIRLFCKYETVQKFHRAHASHHIEYLKNHPFERFNIDGLIIDNECSRLTKAAAQETARQYINRRLNMVNEALESPVDTAEEADYLVLVKFTYKKALERLDVIAKMNKITL